MSENILDFQSQLGSVMEVLVKSVMCEATKLFETGVFQLRAKIANIKEENENLKSSLMSLGGTRPSSREEAGGCVNCGKCEETCTQVTENCSPRLCGGTTAPTRGPETIPKKEEVPRIESVLIKQEESDPEECMSGLPVVSKQLHETPSINRDPANGTSMDKHLMDDYDDGEDTPATVGTADAATETREFWEIPKTESSNVQDIHAAHQAEAQNDTTDSNKERTSEFWPVCSEEDSHAAIDGHRLTWLSDSDLQFAPYIEEDARCTTLRSFSRTDEVFVDFVPAGSVAELSAVGAVNAVVMERDVAQRKPQCHFHNQRGVEAHQSIHTEKKPYSCIQCGKVCISLRGLKRHNQIHLGKKLHQCSQCGKRFEYQFSLAKHQLIHSSERMHACKYCDKTFMFKLDLNIHLRKHSGEISYGCRTCGRQFKHKRMLNLHLKEHSAEKKHHCAHCGKSFRDRGNFKRHKRIHTGEKPYTCHLCGRCFTQSAHLKKHYVTHR
ncbi:zinc finger protein 287-like [Brienomyrus brachyistius]|uniref:zinc finger protein 287-like n=1 Tax=Brienomyrus brachyistius TaxID=42636 RepID=UPI0020B3CA2F|nr:zinc finger protein 287-like [Brienomyrus brachyistius]